MYGLRFPDTNDQTLVVDYCDPSEIKGGTPAVTPANPVAPSPVASEKPPTPALEELFNKTTAQPHIYWKQAPTKPSTSTETSNKPDDLGKRTLEEEEKAESEAKRTKISTSD